MADNLRSNGPAAAYFQPFKNNIFRLDEGYSEETRSQTGSELRAESRQGEVMDSDSPPPLMLPEWIGNMNESERSGTSPVCIYGRWCTHTKPEQS